MPESRLNGHRLVVYSFAIRSRDQSLNILLRLKVLEESRNEQGRRAYVLSKSFTKSLRSALTGGGNHRSFGVPSNTPDDKPVTIDFLDTFARGQWEAILYYVVGSADAGLASNVIISGGTKQLLEGGGFVHARGKNTYITQTGFSFLLQEVNAQIWTLLIEYLKLAENVRLFIPSACSSLTQSSSKWTLSTFSHSSLPSAPSNSAFPTRQTT